MMYLQRNITFKSSGAPPGIKPKLWSDKPVGGDEWADGDGGLQPLFNIQVTGRLVKHETAAEEQKQEDGGQSASSALSSQTKQYNVC